MTEKKLMIIFNYGTNIFGLFNISIKDCMNIRRWMSKMRTFLRKYDY